RDAAACGGDHGAAHGRRSAHGEGGAGRRRRRLLRGGGGGRRGGGGPPPPPLGAPPPAGPVLARGLPPPLPKATASDFFQLYVAPPRRFSPAPTSFAAPRSEVAGAALPYGGLLGGGRDAGGAPISDLFVYDVY